MLPGMIGRLWIAALLGLLALVAPAQAQTAARRTTAVVELYTSQGCMQCGRANRLLGVFSRERGVIALTFPVGIWDYLGWRDTLAQPEFSERQRAYANAMHVRAMSTPHLIFNGVSHNSGLNWDDARALLDAAMATPPPDGAPEVSIVRLRSGRVRVTLSGAEHGAGAEIWLVSYNPSPITVYVASPLYGNRTVTDYNVVSAIERVETWSGEPLWFEHNQCLPECVVLVQRPGPGAILGAATTQSAPWP